ncbi:kinesin-like protein KIF27 isoform X2 [Halichoeres trimaculatus]
MLGSNSEFSFDHVFGPTASQSYVYKSCVQPLLGTLIDGYNATVFCYGQTGSGKTYTMRGGSLDEEEGIIKRVARDLFLLLEEKRTNGDVLQTTVQASYIELYMEELRDLLQPHSIPEGLHLRDNERGNTVLTGATVQSVASAQQLLEIMDKGNSMCHTATTGMNEHSSRSHTILTLQITQTCPDNAPGLFSKLNLVDLAGLERANKTQNTGTLLKESVFINTGLLALGKVMRALTGPKQNRPFVPYRDAKLTRLLRDSLGGTAHTLMVACVSPSSHSVPETVGVLKFASKARRIRNRPGVTQTDVKSFPAALNPVEARLGELEYEVKTLRELLKEKELEIAEERTNRRSGERNSFTPSSQGRLSDLNKKNNQEESTQYCLLALDAAALLAEICGPTPSHPFRQRVQEWQDRLAAVSHSHQDDDKECSERGDGQSNLVDILKLREELKGCKEALAIEEQLLEQKDAELRKVQKEVEQLLQEKRAHVQALEEEKKRSRLQTEQLVDQQIIIKRLRRDIMMFRDATSGARVKTGASENLCWRPHSAPLIRQSCRHRSPRRTHSSPPAYSLERVMAAFKMRGHLLLAEIEENDEVYCPFIKPLAARKGEEEEGVEEEEEVEENTSMDRVGFRRSLNRTWTSRQKKPALKEEHTGTDQTLPGIPSVQATGTEANQSKQREVRRARLRASATQRRIRALSANMHMKEELIKELNKTDKQTKALKQVSEDGTESDVLMRLSMQRQQIQTEVYHSLQHMRLQKAQLQSSLRELELIGEQREEEMTVCRNNHHEELKKELHDRNWLEEEEDQVLQKRAELQELDGELRRREEVLLHREACLQQKNRLEIKKLHSSQALSQDLLRVSMQLESVEERMKSRSSVRQNGGITREELEKERAVLKKRRDILDAQLKDNRILTVQEEHSLLELEEAVEALDAALEFKNHFIQDKQKKLSVADSRSEPAQLSDVIRKLKKLSLTEVLELLMKYFNKVISLREVEHQLRLRCEELQIQADEQDLVIREMEAAMHHLALDADRRLTQQHRDHQKSLQLLLQKLKEGDSGEPQQAIQERLQHLEKELFFYKSSSRQLKKKLRELNSGAQNSVDRPTHSHEQGQTHTDANQLQMHNEEAHARRHILTTYTKIQAEHTDQQTHTDPHMRRQSHQAPCPSSPGIRIESLGQRGRGAGQSGEDLVMTPVRLCRRELRQISPANLQATRRRQSVLDASLESVLEDSIEVSKNTDS